MREQSENTRGNRWNGRGLGAPSERRCNLKLNLHALTFCLIGDVLKREIFHFYFYFYFFIYLQKERGTGVSHHETAGHHN